MTKNERIIKAIFSAVDEVNEQLSGGQQLEKLLDTAILHRSGNLDSLALVNLIVATEQKIEEEFGVTITLADEKAVSQKNSPFRSIGTLVDHVSLRLEGNYG